MIEKKLCVTVETRRLPLLGGRLNKALSDFVYFSVGLLSMIVMEKEIIFKNFYYVSTYALLLPVGVSLYRYTHLKHGTKVFAINLYIALIFFIFNIFSLNIFPNNRFMLYFFVTLDIVFQLWFFKASIKNTSVKNLLLPIGVGFLFYEIVDAFYLTGYRNYSSYCLTVQVVLSAILLLILIRELLIDTSIENLSRHPLAWIATGMLINACTGMLSIFGQLFSSTSRFAFLQLNIVFSLGGLLAYMLYAIGFWQTKRT